MAQPFRQARRSLAQSAHGPVSLTTHEGRSIAHTLGGAFEAKRVKPRRGQRPQAFGSEFEAFAGRVTYPAQAVAQEMPNSGGPVGPALANFVDAVDDTVGEAGLTIARGGVGISLPQSGRQRSPTSTGLFS